MISVIFVCTGNICRSPMAEAIMYKLIHRHHLERKISVDSCGMIGFHAGELADYRARQELEKHGITYYGHARSVNENDFKADYLIAMTKEHKSELAYQKPSWSQTKIQTLMEFTENSTSDVTDPYYNNSFPQTFEILEKGCEALLDHLIKTHQLI